MIADAKARGVDVDCDSYPYAAGSNPLKNILPPWVQAGGVEAMIARLGERETRQKIRADIARDGLNNWGRIPSWDCVQISISPNLPQFAGRTIAAFAAERGADPIDTLCDYLAQDLGATRVLVTSISEDDIRTIVASPLALVGSDGNCVAPYGTVGKGMPHPRFYGTFPRILSRYVREQNALPLALAIHKMTGATARALKLKDRGLLARRLLRRRGAVRSGRFHRSRHLRRSASISVRRAHHRHRQRHAGGRERDPYRRAAGQVLRRDAAGAVG